MFINAGSLVGTTIVTSILGFAYWWVAARRFTPEVVGTASAAISSMTLIGTFCVLGLGTLLITEIPRQPKQAIPLISTALISVAVVGGLAGLIFALVAPLFWPQFSYLNANVLAIMGYASGVSLTSVTLVLDQALVGLLRGVQQFYRNSLFAIIKLFALFLISLQFSNLTGMSVYATWSLGTFSSVVIVLVPVLFSRKRPFRCYLPQWNLLRQMGRAALQHHLLNTMLQFTAYALPTIVTVLLSARMNALFYVSWMLVNFIFYIPAALTTVLHAMNSAHQSTLAARARTTIGLALVVTVFATVVLQFTATRLLSIFGGAYADGAWILRLLVLAAFPIIIKNHYISICRIQDRVKSAIWIIGPGCVLEIILVVIGGRVAGLFGLSLGWVVAVYIEATCMSPTVYGAVVKVKSSALSLEEHIIDIATDAIWLVDTTMLPTITTSQLSAITSSRLPAITATEFHIVKKEGTGEANNRKNDKSLKEKQLGSNHIRRLKPPRLQPFVPQSSEVCTEEKPGVDQGLERSRQVITVLNSRA